MQSEAPHQNGAAVADSSEDRPLLDLFRDDEEVEAAPVSGFPEYQEPWKSSIIPALLKMKAFVLDPRYQSCAAACNAAYSQPPAPMPADLATLRKLRTTAELGQLRPEALGEEDGAALEEWLLRVATSTQARDISGLESDFARTLPIFPTLAGGRAAAAGPDDGLNGACAESTADAVFGNATSLPSGLRRRLLAADAYCAPLLSMLRIPILDDAALLVAISAGAGERGLAALPDGPRAGALEFVQREWPRLQGDHRLVETLSASAFVPRADGTFARPSDLYDPSHPVLSTAFADQPVFPSGRFAHPPWLDILRRTGLKRHMDRDAFLDAARGAARRAAGLAKPWNGGDEVLVLSLPGEQITPEAQAAWGAACALADLLSQGEEEAEGLLWGQEGREFGRKVGEVPFFPAWVWRPGTGAPGAALARLRNCAAAQDWPLVWAALPVLASDAAAPPPKEHWSALGLRSPPPFDAVLCQLAAVDVDSGEAALSCWPSGPDCASPEAASLKILEQLEAEGLSERQLRRVAGAALVPVANATKMAVAAELFVRLPVDASPFFYEASSLFFFFFFSFLLLRLVILFCRLQCR
jgi:hypothetical protein